MRGLVLLLTAALVAGCSATTRVNVAAGTGGAVPTGGTSVSGGALGVHVQGGSGAAALVAAGVVVAALASRDELLERSRVLPWQPSAPPEMLEGRSVNEQDCTKPIKNPTANLRCR